jgi:hypothetical protein
VAWLFRVNISIRNAGWLGHGLAGKAAGDSCADRLAGNGTDE